MGVKIVQRDGLISAIPIAIHTGLSLPLGSLADNKAALNLFIGPQPNYTADIWPQCLATDLLAGIGDCGAVDRPRLTAYSVGPQRDHAPMPSSVRTPRTVRVPAQHRVDA